MRRRQSARSGVVKILPGSGMRRNFPAKHENLPSGEGGIITTNDDALCSRIRSMLDGSHDKFYTDHNVTEFHASILSTQLDKLDDEIIRRERMAAYLDARLNMLPSSVR